MTDDRKKLGLKRFKPVKPQPQEESPPPLPPPTPPPPQDPGPIE